MPPGRGIWGWIGIANRSRRGRNGRRAEGTPRPLGGRQCAAERFGSIGRLASGASWAGGRAGGYPGRGLRFGARPDDGGAENGAEGWSISEKGGWKGKGPVRAHARQAVRPPEGRTGASMARRADRSQARISSWAAPRGRGFAAADERPGSGGGFPRPRPDDERTSGQQDNRSCPGRLRRRGRETVVLTSCRPEVERPGSGVASPRPRPAVLLFRETGVWPSGLRSAGRAR